MYSQLKSAIVVGIDAVTISIEVDSSNGLPGTTIVGLPDTATNESRERVRSALHNSGASYPARRITVNLAPAHLKKERAFFDLPLALGVASIGGTIAPGSTEGHIIVGELALSGETLPLRGILPIAVMARKAGAILVAPAANYGEVSLVEGLDFRLFESLGGAVEYFRDGAYSFDAGRAAKAPAAAEKKSHCDMADIYGQSCAKRAIEIAAAGGHAILLKGPPGAGKTMLASCMPGILPPMTLEESLEVSKIYSVSGLLGEGGLMRRRAFRAPHHTISEAALIGGCGIPRPGEVSLAHNGVLFLDEFTEYRRSALESLRQPLSDGFVTISRARAAYTYPARFALAAACNPCPCGYLGDERTRCRCSPKDIARYESKFSGPIVDRIDIKIDVGRVDLRDGAQFRRGEATAAVAERVARARASQVERFREMNEAGANRSEQVFSNGAMRQEHIRRFCRLEGGSEALLRKTADRFDLSMRAYFKILKVARTIADISGRADIGKEDLLEAIQYRTGRAE